MDINDLYAAQKIKQSNKMEFFNSILQKCHHRIKTVAQKSETFCFYIVPEFSLGTPLYNVYQCCQYIISHLKNGGFNVLYVRPNLLYISWDLSQYLTPNQIQQIDAVPRLQSSEQVKYNIQQNLLRDLVPIGMGNSNPSPQQSLPPNMMGFNVNSNISNSTISNSNNIGNSNSNIKQIQYNVPKNNMNIPNSQPQYQNHNYQNQNMPVSNPGPNIGNPNINPARSIKDYKPTGRIIL